MSIFATQALTVCAVRQPAGWRGKGDGGQWSSRRWGATGSRKQKKLRRGLDEVGGRWGGGWEMEAEEGADLFCDTSFDRLKPAKLHLKIVSSNGVKEGQSGLPPFVKV